MTQQENNSAVGIIDGKWVEVYATRPSYDSILKNSEHCVILDRKPDKDDVNGLLSIFEYEYGNQPLSYLE